MPSTISLTMRSNASLVTCAEGLAAARDRRHQLPAIGFGRLDEAGQADIDVAHDLEHVGAMRHRRPAAAMHEIVIGRLGRREGVGLVQEAADGDAGHQCLSQCFHCGTLSVSLRQAQAAKQSRFACRVIRNATGCRRESRSSFRDASEGPDLRRAIDTGIRFASLRAGMTVSDYACRHAIDTGRKLAKSQPRPGAASSSARV